MFWFNMANRRWKWSVLIAAFILVAAAGCAVAQQGASVPGSELSEEANVNDLDFAQVRYVVMSQLADGSWRFDVTVEHADEGWDHYADQWEVVDPVSGEVIAERVLLHPHETEQPFTRSQSNVIIPNELHEVMVRAKCNVDGYGGYEVLIDLRVQDGELYSITRR